VTPNNGRLGDFLFVRDPEVERGPEVFFAGRLMVVERLLDRAQEVGQQAMSVLNAHFKAHPEAFAITFDLRDLAPEQEHVL
jgi:hypothetical protein